MKKPNTATHPKPEEPDKTRSLNEIIHAMGETGVALLNAEIDLVKIELQDEFASEILFTRRIIIAAAMLIIGANLSIVGLLVLLSKFVELWISAIILGITLLATGLMLLIITWRRHASLSAIGDNLKDRLFPADLKQEPKKPSK